MIGFSQRIQLDWLKYTANLALASHSRDDIVAALRERLRDQLSVGSDPERGNREKAITILTKVWVTVPSEFQWLRDEGLELLQRLPAGGQMLVHWCMCMAVYPFFGAVTEATGRLLHLQGTAAAAQVQRRIREQMGERETVSRAARRILRALVDWGVLVETVDKGIYRGHPSLVVNDNPLVIWALKAVLASRGNKSLSLSGALQGHHLFPFEIASPSIRELERCKAFEISRHGLDQEILLSLAVTVSCGSNPDSSSRPS